MAENNPKPNKLPAVALLKVKYKPNQTIEEQNNEIKEAVKEWITRNGGNYTLFHAETFRMSMKRKTEEEKQNEKQEKEREKDDEKKPE
jgi:hypothetical protein